MKISILMPTYNDADTIIESLDSLKNQKNKNWELIIINDGSTDDTEDIINNYINKNKLKTKMKYIHQSNQDQLRAILNGSKYITGDYVMFLHSDDLLYDKNTIDNIFNEFKSNKKADVIFHNLVKIDENSNETGELITKKYTKDINNLVLTLLFLGRNIFIDVFIAKKDFFLSQIKDNYLIWNCPFWINFDNDKNQPNIYNSNIHFMKYRVYENNYINNELGKLNVINGELRCATRLMKKYNIPMFKLQFYIYRIFNKLKFNYHVIYSKKESTNKYNIINFILNKRFNDESWNNNLFLNSLYLFYKNTTDRTIKLEKINNDEFIYLGCDMRKFNKAIINNKLSTFYISVLNEMKKGFTKVIVKKGDLKKSKDIFKFLCIYDYIIIEEEK